MRDIKFRAWHKIESKMFYNVYDVSNTKTYNFMQYTGLKDATGKEIFEGDIVECGDMGKGTVYYDIDIGGFAVNMGDTTFDCFINDAELVIGNIHENPELLEK